MSCSRLHQAQLHRCCVVVKGGTRSLPCCCCVGTFTWRCQPQATACSSCSLPSLSADNTSTTCPCLLTSLNIFCQNNAGIYHIWKPWNIMLHNLSSMRWSSAYNLYTESRILVMQKECWNDLHTRCPPKKWGSSSIALLKQQATASFLLGCPVCRGICKSKIKWLNQKFRYHPLIIFLNLKQGKVCITSKILQFIKS